MIKGILDTARQEVRAHLSCYRAGYQSAAGPTQTAVVPVVPPYRQAYQKSCTKSNTKTTRRINLHSKYTKYTNS